MTIQCCVCRKVEMDGKWAVTDESVASGVSHTYCPVCLQRALSEFKDELGKPLPRLTGIPVRA
ncbi:MAG: hypothetical protein GWP08_05170 [Nitrospiraceae bacterium]|nr:hypothetical protein [Nitrospiraceae bacterium]